MKSSAVTVATTPTLIVASDDQNRWIYIHNSGGSKIYVGDSAVTTSTGFHIANTESQQLFLPSKETLYGVVASGTNIINILTPNVD